MNTQGWSNRWQDHLHTFQVKDSYAGITRSVCGVCSVVSIGPSDEPVVRVSQPQPRPVAGAHSLWGGVRLASQVSG